jgi:hypothetical protein
MPTPPKENNQMLVNFLQTKTTCDGEKVAGKLKPSHNDHTITDNVRAKIKFGLPPFTEMSRSSSDTKVNPIKL